MFFLTLLEVGLGSKNHSKMVVKMILKRPPRDFVVPLFSFSPSLGFLSTPLYLFQYHLVSRRIASRFPTDIITRIPIGQTEHHADVFAGTFCRKGTCSIVSCSEVLVCIKSCASRCTSNISLKRLLCVISVRPLVNVRIDLLMPGLDGAYVQRNQRLTVS